jgi:tetratricopeptide (TPR) repeat protein
MLRAMLALIVLSSFAIRADEPKPQAQRMLTGADAKAAEELTDKSDAAARADRYDEAIKLCEQLVALRTRVQGADHWETIDEKWTLDAARKVAALPAAKRAAWWKVFQDSSKKAEQLEDKDRFAEALPLRQEYVRWCEEIFGKRHPKTANAYGQLAINLRAQDRLAESLPLYEKDLEINRELLGERHPDTGSSYNNLAIALKAAGRIAEALPHIRKALDVAREVYGEKHVNTASSYNVLGNTLAELGQHAEAQSCLQKSLDLRRELLGENHRSTASSYNNLAYVLADQGKHADAHPLFRRSHEISLILYGERHVFTAQSYDALGDSFEALGRPSEALPMFTKALNLYRELRGERNAETAKSYNNVARALTVQKKYADAEVLYQKALDIYRERVGERHPDTAQTYQNLGHCLAEDKRFAEAQDVYRKALDIRKERLGPRHPYTIATSSSLATILEFQDKHAEAQAEVERVLEAYRERLGERHPNTATGYAHLAMNLACQGKYAEAQPLYQKAQDLRRELLGERHPDTALGFNNWALSLVSEGKYAEARALLDRATSAYDAARLNVAERGIDRATFGAERSPYRLLAAVHAKLGDPVAAWTAAEADLARGLADEATTARPTPAEAKQQTELEAALDALQPRHFRLVSKAMLSDTEQAELTRLRAERDRLEAQLAGLSVARSRRSLAPLAAVQAALTPDAALVIWVDATGTVGRVQEHWGCVVRRTGDPHWERLPATGPDGAWTKEDRAGAANLLLALTNPAVPQGLLELTAQRLHAQRLAPLEKHLAGVKQLFVVPVHMMSRVPVEAVNDKYTISYVPSGSYLARLKDRVRPSGPNTILALGDPVFDTAGRPTPTAAGELPPGGVLITQIVPGGAAATARLRPGDVLLKYAGSELKSAEDLGKLIADHATDKSVAVTVWRARQKDPAIRDVAPGKLGVVLAKEPAPEAVANRRKTDALIATVSRGRDWGDLPGTRIEVARLAALFGDAATTLTDSAASERQLDTLRAAGKLKDFRYLHLATHGESDNARAFESALILSQDDRPDPARLKPGEKDFDGRLTANEVLESWKLDADLVTLSACESGLGRFGGGDGLLGFAQAFLLAGSRSVCLSLWKVDDAATALLMDRFYRNLLGKRAGLDKPLAKAQALAEAKKWLRELTADDALKLTADLTQGVARGTRGKERALPLLPAVPEAAPATDPKAFRPYAHPRYWAAFILIGDPG